MILEKIVTGPLQENCFIVGDENTKSGYVIDPGWDENKIKNVLDKLGLEDVTILLTHGHFDHISAAGLLRQLTGAKILMSPLDEYLLGNVQGSMAQMCGMGVTPFEVDGPINEGDEFTVGDIKLVTLHTPGHTPGGMSFYDGNEIVFVGDSLFRDSVGRVDFPGSNGKDLFKSITEVLYKLPDDTIVYSGHGPETSIGYEKQNNPYTLHPEYLTGAL